jgi:hypothetical protein
MLSPNSTPELGMASIPCCKLHSCGKGLEGHGCQTRSNDLAPVSTSVGLLGPFSAKHIELKPICSQVFRLPSINFQCMLPAYHPPQTVFFEHIFLAIMLMGIHMLSCHSLVLHHSQLHYKVLMKTVYWPCVYLKEPHLQSRRNYIDKTKGKTLDGTRKHAKHDHKSKREREHDQNRNKSGATAKPRGHHQPRQGIRPSTAHHTRQQPRKHRTGSEGNSCCDMFGSIMASSAPGRKVMAASQAHRCSSAS